MRESLSALFVIAVAVTGCQSDPDASTGSASASDDKAKAHGSTARSSGPKVSASASAAAAPASPAPTGSTTAAAPTASAAAPADPFAFFDGPAPALTPTKRSGVWPYGATAPILPEWEGFAEGAIQRKDRSAFFLLWNINATSLDETILTRRAKLVPLRATAGTLGKVEPKRTVGKVADARVGVGQLTIDGAPATLWFAEAGVKCSKPGVESSDHMVWLFVAKDSAPDAVRDEGRYLLQSITPLTDCSDL